MSSPWIEGLRSVALNVPDLAKAESFYTRCGTWKSRSAATACCTCAAAAAMPTCWRCMQGGPVPQIRHVTLRARSEDGAAGGGGPRARGRRHDGLAGRCKAIPPAASACAARPGWPRVPGRARRPARVDGGTEGQAERLTHVVLNSHAVDDTQKFLEQALGFTLADRTGIMAFMNCNRDHHTLAIGIADNDALNHIAFLMPDYESVMRGGGRMRDAGFPIQWGPGRHGPGNNLFNYFIDPFGVVIEYTAEVEQVDESYKPRGPADWKWPPGRVDQWGISPRPPPDLKEARVRSSSS
jgi:catechol 2,3-dioxygenase-like lactoylglutathione lyase family enzyme